MKRFALAGLVALALLMAPAAASAQVELVPPEVSGFSLTPRVFSVGPQRGATMRYTLSEDASVYVAIIRLRPGLLSEGDCLPVTTDAGRRMRRQSCSQHIKPSRVLPETMSSRFCLRISRQSWALSDVGMV